MAPIFGASADWSKPRLAQVHLSYCLNALNGEGGVYRGLNRVVSAITSQTAETQESLISENMSENISGSKNISENISGSKKYFLNSFLKTFLNLKYF